MGSTEIISRPERPISSLHVIFSMMSNKNMGLICCFNPQICSTKIVKCTKSNLACIGCQEDNGGQGGTEPKKSPFQIPSPPRDVSERKRFPAGGQREGGDQSFIQTLRRPSKQREASAAGTWAAGVLWPSHFAPLRLHIPLCHKGLPPCPLSCCGDSERM